MAEWAAIWATIRWCGRRKRNVEASALDRPICGWWFGRWIRPWGAEFHGPGTWWRPHSTSAGRWRWRRPSVPDCPSGCRPFPNEWPSPSSRDRSPGWSWPSRWRSGGPIPATMRARCRCPLATDHRRGPRTDWTPPARRSPSWPHRRPAAANCWDFQGGGGGKFPNLISRKFHLERPFKVGDASYLLEETSGTEPEPGADGVGVRNDQQRTQQKYRDAQNEWTTTPHQRGAAVRPFADARDGEQGQERRCWTATGKKKNFGAN